MHETDAHTYQKVLEEKLPAVKRAVEECYDVVRKTAKERAAAWEQWQAAQEESSSSRLLRQHIQAEQQLQRAMDCAIGQMQVFSFA